MQDDTKRFLVACFDLMLIIFSYYAAFAIRFEMAVPLPWLTFMSGMLLVIIPIQFCTFWYFGLYGTAERFGTADDLVSIVKAILISSLAVVPAVYAMSHFAGYGGYPPRSLFVLHPLALMIMIGGARFSMRLIREIRSARKGMKRVLIVGAGEAAESILREIIKNGELNYRPVGLVDDDRQKIGSTLHGVKVLGPSESIKKLVEQHGAGEVMIAIPSATGAEMRRIVGFCKECGVPYKTLPGMSQIIDGKARVDTLREVHYNDLLRREPIVLNNDLKPAARNEKVLVIGGAGYLGTVLTCRLLENGYTIRVLDSLIYGKKPMQFLLDREGFDFVQGDIRNIETVVSALEDVDGVILLAAIVGDQASKARPSETVQTNYLASLAVARACKMKQINRFIYASTCSVYGVGGTVLDEDSPLNPVSLYARTKIASEEGIFSISDSNFAPAIMRMSTLYGPSPRMRFDLVVNTMTMNAFLEKKITVLGGEQWRPLLDIRDASNAYLKVLEADINTVKGEVYNVGCENQNYKIKDVAALIGDTLDTPVETVPSDTDARDYRVSFNKIRNDLGFEVKHTIEGAVREIYHKLEIGEITDPRGRVYYNHFFDPTEVT